MLSVTQLDYNNYWRAFKGNYAKGIRALANILQTPQQANDLTSNLGGVSVLLGTPVGSEDVNSETLRTMLLESAYADNAVNTWLGGFYTFDDLSTLFADQTVRDEVRTSPLLWRAVSMGSTAMAKYVSNIVGLNPDDYADMQAIVDSSLAMEAVINSPTALNTIANSAVAMKTVVASTVVMEAVAASYVAEAAIWASSSAVAIVKGNSAAWSIFTGASSSVIGKTAAVLAGLNPDDYADMQAVATSSTAMQAVAASSTAMQAVAAFSTAMKAIAASSTAMQAIAASSTAREAVKGSSSAISALARSPLKSTVSDFVSSQGQTRIVYSGNMWLISASVTVSSADSLGWCHYYPIGVSSPNSIAAGKGTSVNAFASKIEIYNGTSGTSISCTADIIKC